MGSKKPIHTTDQYDAEIDAQTDTLLAEEISAAGAPVLPYQSNDFAQGGFHNILPPGENGRIDLKGLLAYESGGTRSPHSFDQYAMYQNLLYGSPGLTAADLPKYFKDASFGVKPADVESTEQTVRQVEALFQSGEDLWQH